ncbi:MAG: efflux RND transporter permease subunit, partial [Chitinophagaceae bacterium]|nr:efflux RND transporter permease subunit [Chitinophagaceae bacterium]
MFKKIVSWSTINRNKTIFLGLLFTLLGVYAGMSMEVDVLPDINKPTVIVFAEADGLAPEEVEKAVLIPLENAVLGTAGVERVRGTASFALGIINIEFPFDSDIYKNRQLVQERISAVAVPPNVKVTLGPVSSVMGEIMWAGVKSDSNISPTDLRTFVDFTLRPNLLKVKGISDVIVMGGDVLEWQVRLNADALSKYNVTQEEINLVLERNLQNASAGIIQQQNKEYAVRIFVAPKEISELADIAIHTENGSVRLGEIASFVEGASIVRGGASVDGSQGIILRIFKQPNAETLEVTEEVDSLFVNLQKTVPSGITLRTDLFRQEWFISAGLSNVEKALFEALIIVGLVVFLVLTKWRPALITLLAIPTSIAVTAIIFKLLGLSVNVMTLGGIAVATSELVDDAIVSVENIIKRLRGKKAVGLERLKIIIDAVQEVRGSIIYAT